MAAEILEYLNSKKPEIDKAIEKYMPRKMDKKSAEWIFGKGNYEYDLKALEQALSKPVWDLLDRGGKRWRPGLFLLIAEAFGLKPETVMDFTALLEVLHNGSLMVDDIEDLSEQRRGEPAIHKIFGEDVAVNAGNFMYFLPSLVLKKNAKVFEKDILVRAWEAYAQEMINIHAGQGMDIWWHKGKGEPTEKNYLQMCAYKSGTLPRLACRLGVILAGGSKEAEEALGNVGESIGVAFQIQDDLLSASGEKFQEFKGYGDDITEGKRSLIVIHALGNLEIEDRSRLLEILNSHTKEKELIDEALDLLKKSKSLYYANKRAKEIAAQAWEKAGPLVPESEAKTMIRKLVNFAIERDI